MFVLEESSCIHYYAPMRGKVKRFSEISGRGIISGPSGELFPVGYRDIAGEGFRTLDEGEFVQFDICWRNGTLIASNVQRLDPRTHKRGEGR
jgi:cold shock CspA family protein